eukprot:COSAG06_NODE_518_length_14769_cov_75.390048_9_plen_50_part_00
MMIKRKKTTLNRFFLSVWFWQVAAYPIINNAYPGPQTGEKTVLSVHFLI